MNWKNLINKKNIILILCTIVFCISAGVLLHKYISEKKAQDKFESLSNTGKEETEATESSETEIEENVFTYLGIEDPAKNLDWEYLWEQNPDIYAWIYIPNTKIDYPVLQHETDDTYYLLHNLDGSQGRPGCIYTERLNQKDFSDYNTVLYGHNMRVGTMFADLHKFEEQSFFEEEKYFFIYTPDGVNVYEIFAAYEFSNLHILYNFDCTTSTGFESYMNMVFENYTDAGYFREGIEITAEDKIVTLSTCVRGNDNLRYLVQGVLVEYETEE